MWNSLPPLGSPIINRSRGRRRRTKTLNLIAIVVAVVADVALAPPMVAATVRILRVGGRHRRCRRRHPLLLETPRRPDNLRNRETDQSKISLQLEKERLRTDKWERVEEDPRFSFFLSFNLSDLFGFRESSKGKFKVH